jgi:hypothetical protein
LLNLFGYRNWIPPLGEDYSHDQVFRRRDLAKVIAGLQDSFARGLGAVCEADLVTVENKVDFSCVDLLRCHLLLRIVSSLYFFGLIFFTRSFTWIPLAGIHGVRLLPREKKEKNRYKTTPIILFF